MPFKGHDGIPPHFRKRCGLIRLGIKINHDGSASGFQFPCVAVHQVLQQRQTLVAQAGALCEHLNGFLEQGGHKKTAVHVGNDDGRFAPVDISLDLQTCKIFSLGQVKELEINRIVDVAQGVDVVKAQLHCSAAFEGILGLNSVRIHIDGFNVLQ